MLLPLPCRQQQQGQQRHGASSGSPLAPVLELYSCRHLLPSPEEDARVRVVLAACRRLLHMYWDWKEPLQSVGLEGSEPLTKVQLLAWLLGDSDEVRIANDPQQLQLWLELPMGALEELLQADHLSTDDEATVVLLVEQWVAAQGWSVSLCDKERVRRQLRLVSSCSTSYLFDVLPKLRGLGAQQAAFLARCRLTDRSEWRQHASHLLECYGTSSPWYGEPRSQSVPEEGVSYKWEISREDCNAALQQQPEGTQVYAKFQLPGGSGVGVTRVTALGLEWRVAGEYKQVAACAIVRLQCHVPAALHAQTGPLQGSACVSARLEVHVPRDRSGGTCRRVMEYHVVPYEECSSSGGRAQTAVARQGQQPDGGTGAAAADNALPLGPWPGVLGPYGKLTGLLTFFRLGGRREGGTAGA